MEVSQAMQESQTPATTSPQADERASWSGKWGFILAAAASAVGLGNLWRFPYLAARYGGGAFLLVYLVLVVTFGFALMMGETALGRITGQSAIGAFSYFGRKYRFIGVLASLVPFIITPYYCIIGGWVTKYMTAYLTDGPAKLADGGDFFVGFMTSPIASHVFMLIFMVLVLVVVALGVKNGIEKANMVMMPALIIMAVAIAVFTMTMPGALEGAAYYLVPDFSKFSGELVINALGQMFYSLSLAMAIMITYGSYMRKEDSLTQSVARIGIFDFGVSFVAGLMIVPGAFMAMGSAEAVAAKSGPSLMFITLPQLFNSMPAGVATLIGFVFFLLVLFAALTSAISLTEACTSIIQDGTGWSRNKSLGVVGAFIIVAGFIINLGYSGLDFIQPMGEGSTILDFMDFVSNSVIMPIVAIFTCIFVGWILKPKVIIDEVRISSPFKAAGAWTVMIKYIAPILVVAILAWNIYGTFFAG